MKETAEFEAKRASVLMASAVSTCLGLLGAAVASRRAWDAEQTKARQKLSASAWRTGLLKMAGHDMDAVRKLDEQILAAPHLFPATGGYIHECSRMIAENGWWGPGETAPLTPMSDRRQAETELARVGASIWTALVLAVELCEHTTPAAFGPVHDRAVYEGARQKIADHAAAALEAFRAVPLELQVGMAYRRDLEVDPLGSLPERLVAHSMNPAKAPTRRLERRGEVAMLG